MIECYVDLESSGLDPQTDRVVEVMLLRVDEEGSAPYRTYVNPGIPIPAETTKIHGITDAMVADCPTFEDIADDVQELIDDAVIIGYNSRSFDVPMLHAELLRAGRAGFPTNNDGAIDIREIDLLLVWKASEDRKLTTAVRRFAGVEHADAHSAEADVLVLLPVMQGMRDEFGLADDLEEMMLLTCPENAVDRDGKFAKNEEGKFIFTFGKHDGKPVSRNLNYVEWMLKSNFSTETKAWCKRFIAWGRGKGGL